MEEGAEKAPRGYRLVNAVLEKSVKMHTDGMAAIEKGGVKLFEGYSPDVSKRYMVAGSFEFQTEVDSLIDLITQNARSCNVELFCATKDFPLHTTIGEGEVPEGMSIENMEGDFASHKGKRALVFSELVMQNGNILLTVEDIPDWFYQLRDEVNKAYAMLGFTPLPIENLVHITLARITQGNDQAIRNFSVIIDELRHDVKKVPIILAIDGLFKGSSINFLNSKPL
jgi:hypothetical protein